jgi:hypothetical protein
VEVTVVVKARDPEVRVTVLRVAGTPTNTYVVVVAPTPRRPPKVDVTVVVKGTKPVV